MRDHARRKKPPIHKPFPDAIEDGFKVVEGSGGVSFDGRIMHVPLGESDMDRFVRLHEMGHLRFTPRQSPEKVCAKHGLDMSSLQVCEDARINTLLTGKGFPMSELGETDPDLPKFRQTIEEMLAKGKVTEALRFGAECLVALRHRAEKPARQILSEILPGAIPYADGALSFLDGRTPSFQRTVKAAKFLTEAFNNREALTEGPGNLGSEGESLLRCGIVDKLPWGEMTVVTPRRTHRTCRKVSPKFRVSDVGLRLRRVSRVLTDGRCFAHRTKQVGGSLLIDGSGSMSLSPEDVRQILEVAPVAWVAIYGASVKKGAVKILADKGTVVAPEDMTSPGGCNVIDGPALRLLAQQSRPRIWICDGRVTGVGDQCAFQNTVECAKICDDANIRRIETVTEAVTYLRSLSRLK